jgi:hypothetical protein
MIWTYVATAIIASALSFGGAWKVQNWRHDAMEKARIEAEAELQRLKARRVDVASVAHEEFKTKERVVYEVITQTVDKIVERPVYRNVCLDDDGLRALNAAVTGANASGEPAPAVPGPAPGK